MKNNPVGWFEMYVQDMPRAKKFYEEVFSTKLTSLPSTHESLEMWGFPMDQFSKGSGGSLVLEKGFDSKAGNSVVVYFASQDCAIEEKKIKDAGGKLQKPKSSIGEFGFISVGVDTEGNVFGIHSIK